MKARVLVILAAALVALAGVALVVVYASGAGARALAANQPRQVYITTELVPAGTGLQDAVDKGMLKRTTVPANATPDGALTTVTSDNASLVAVNDIQPGELVLGSRFQKEAAGTPAIAVPDGLVAAAASMQGADHVGSFVTPGSKVVVFYTWKDQAGDVHSETLLSNALVIAVDERPLSGGTGDSASAKSTTASDAAVVTFALSPKDALRLAYARASGTLSLALRSAGAQASEGTTVSGSSLSPS